ncbi:polysaccharide pyruvyl transferase family protein [Cellulosimicrobium funkei]|nr:polysaccharide pyruvyl transferase family protein [Cellulosimicrobium funkei]
MTTARPDLGGPAFRPGIGPAPTWAAPRGPSAAGPREAARPHRGGRPRVGLVGFFGWGNYGDELFLRLWRQRLSAHFDVGPVHQLLQPPYVIGDPAEVAEEYDAFVIGGGDLVLPNQVSTLYWKREWLQKKVYICGVGVPLWKHRERDSVVEHLAEFFRHPNVQYISARDEESATWIRERLRPHQPVVVHPDLVFALEKPTAAAEDGTRRLGISVRPGLYGQSNDYSVLQRLVEAARRSGYRITALELSSGRQRRRDAQAYRQLPFTPDEFIRSRGVLEDTAAIGRVDALASMKFHGLVVALMYGRPALALTPNTKSRNLLTDAGRSDLVLDSGTSGDDEVPSGEDLLTRLREPVDAHRIAAWVDEAGTALEQLVWQMRLQLSPGDVGSQLLRHPASTARAALPLALELRRREREVRRLHEAAAEDASEDGDGPPDGGGTGHDVGAAARAGD